MSHNAGGGYAPAHLYIFIVMYRILIKRVIQLQLQAGDGRQVSVEKGSQGNPTRPITTVGTIKGYSGLLGLILLPWLPLPRL